MTLALFPFSETQVLYTKAVRTDVVAVPAHIHTVPSIPALTYGEDVCSLFSAF
jgi:hypothetical protein